MLFSSIYNFIVRNFHACDRCVTTRAHWGFVKLTRMRRHGGRCDECSESDRRILGDFGDFAPGDKSISELFAIKLSAQQVSLEREMLPNWLEARENFLCSFGITKTAHATLAFTRGLITILDSIVQPGGRFDEHMLYVRQLLGLGLGRLRQRNQPAHTGVVFLLTCSVTEHRAD